MWNFGLRSESAFAERTKVSPSSNSHFCSFTSIITDKTARKSLRDFNDDTVLLSLDYLDCGGRVDIGMGSQAGDEC